MLKPNMRSQVLPILRSLDEIMIASWLKQDTLENIRNTGEFVVNVPRSVMAKDVEICARNYPPEVDEFVEAGLSPRASVKVETPRDRGVRRLDGVRSRRGDPPGEVLPDHRQGGPSGGERRILRREG